jgi:ribosome maturation factor RimP
MPNSIICFENAPFRRIFALGKSKRRRERGRSLLLLSKPMADYKNDIIGLLEPLLESDTFLVDFKIKPTNNIKIFLDSDLGLSIEKCVRINRALYKKIEEAVMFKDGDFSLEISSPGVDEPLKLHRQYIKNTGRNVEVTKNDGTLVAGKMTSVNDEAINLQFTEGKGKKAVEKNVEILFSDIKQTKVLISF